jgi:hypothetical protein
LLGTLNDRETIATVLQGLYSALPTHLKAHSTSTNSEGIKESTRPLSIGIYKVILESKSRKI